MDIENGEWIMSGIDEADPECIHTPEQLIDHINEVGFLPLFKNEIDGFSVEEKTPPYYWWCEEPAHDPWIWREILARSGKVAYGKLFNKKAGFISLEWLPYFANCRRDGYDFDALWDDEKASLRQKKIMDLFLTEGHNELYSFEIKNLAGFGTGGEKNFEGTITALQMQTYLVIKDFRCRVNKKGENYGWRVAVYSTPESLWGRDAVTAAYDEEPSESWRKIEKRVLELYPRASDKQIRKII